MSELCLARNDVGFLAEKKKKNNQNFNEGKANFWSFMENGKILFVEADFPH